MDFDLIAWKRWKAAWKLDPNVTYLNHGSFGPSPLEVQAARQRWSERLERDPMRFFLEELQPALWESLQSLAAFVGTEPDNLAFVDNATCGMNAVADSVPLEAGDEVLLNDHEYGACRRIWERACQRQHAALVTQSLSFPTLSETQLIEELFARVTDRTRVLVVSHITSPTALIFPVKRICQLGKQRGLIVVIDGPHAPAMVPLELRELNCDFYAASCHKWLCAPFGSGFLYVASQWQQNMQPSLTSWGRMPGAKRQRWQEDFHWVGTRDASAWLAIPAAINFLHRVGLDAFRSQSHQLAKYASDAVASLTNLAACAPESMFGSMVTLPLPMRDYSQLQRKLWEEAQIEVPIIHWNDRYFVRISCHLYNCPDDVDLLVRWLDKLL